MLWVLILRWWHRHCCDVKSIAIFKTVDAPFIDCGNSLCIVWYSYATIFNCTQDCHKSGNWRHRLYLLFYHGGCQWWQQVHYNFTPQDKFTQWIIDTVDTCVWHHHPGPTNGLNRIVPSLTIVSHIGIRTLCKAGCKVLFDNKKCEVMVMLFYWGSKSPLPTHGPCLFQQKGCVPSQVWIL